MLTSNPQFLIAHPGYLFKTETYSLHSSFTNIRTKCSEKYKSLPRNLNFQNDLYLYLPLVWSSLICRRWKRCVYHYSFHRLLSSKKKATSLLNPDSKTLLSDTGLCWDTETLCWDTGTLCWDTETLCWDTGTEVAAVSQLSSWGRCTLPAQQLNTSLNTFNTWPSPISTKHQHFTTSPFTHAPPHDIQALLQPCNAGKLVIFFVSSVIFFLRC